VLLAHLFPNDPDSPLRALPAGWPYGLKWIQLVSAGVDGFPRWFLEGPIVTTARGVTAEPIAEYVLAVLLSAVKQLPALWVKQPQDWSHRRLTMLRGSTLGLVGFGAVGQAIAAKLQPLGVFVKVLRRSAVTALPTGMERIESLEALFEQCDHVVLAAPATPESRHMVDAGILSHARPGLHLVNVARGSLVDHDALLDALDAGRLGAATLDVTDPEPLPQDHPLYRHPRVNVSPHTSAISAYSSAALLDKFVRNLEAYRRGAPLEDVFDPSRGY
jgi:phosphoglycerate dehydrogenase-like enzyme